MALAIRLRRMGAKKRPFYRIVVAESGMPRDGRYIESVGYYNPITNPPDVKLDEERVLNWLTKGAKPSDTTRSLLSRAGVYAKWAAQRQGGQAATETDAQAAADVDIVPEEAEPKKATPKKRAPKKATS